MFGVHLCGSLLWWCNRCRCGSHRSRCSHWNWNWWRRLNEWSHLNLWHTSWAPWAFCQGRHFPWHCSESFLAVYAWQFGACLTTATLCASLVIFIEYLCHSITTRRASGGIEFWTWCWCFASLAFRTVAGMGQINSFMAGWTDWTLEGRTCVGNRSTSACLTSLSVDNHSLTSVAGSQAVHRRACR